MTGVRPSEIFGITLSDGLNYISGAKKSHSGLRGADRVIQANHQFYENISSLLEILAESSKSIDAIRMTIRKVLKVLFKGNRAPSMYSVRHQFGADLKASELSALEIAYIMGHQSTASVARYGDKRCGRSGAVSVWPAPIADLSQVREKRYSHTVDKLFPSCLLNPQDVINEFESV